MSRINRRAVLCVLTGGIVAGAADLAYVLTLTAVRGGQSIRVLQSIASGVLGKAAFVGGARSAALGLLCHFAIASVAACVYFVLSRRYDALARRVVLGGSLFGLMLFVVMNYVVIPLSAAMTSAPSGWPLARSLLVHATLVGIPIAWFARLARSAS